MEDIKTMAEHFHSEGFSCAESMVRACNNCLDLHLSDDALRMASGLGGGLGGSGCVCGALNGACLIIGVVAGRKELTDRPKPEIYKDIREFQQLFTKTFGSTCCHFLKGPELHVVCETLTGNTAAMLEKFLREKGLKK